ncbi:MAG: PaaX family transcriptional regulator [Pseudoclavibacter sp.]
MRRWPYDGDTTAKEEEQVAGEPSERDGASNRAERQGRTLPRFQNGPRSQQLLTVLLGDYWYARNEAVPSAALVELLSVFDVTPGGARAAVQRLSQRGFFDARKIGRNTAYAVPLMSQDAANAHISRLFLSHLPEPWDGTWTLVAYSLPDAARGARRGLREGLRQAGFGNLYDAVWVRPRDASDAVARLVDALGDDVGPEHVTVFVGATVPGVGQAAAEKGVAGPAVRDAFELDALASEYRSFIERWAPFAEHPGRTDGARDALRTRTSIMADWRRLRHADPRLPHAVYGDGFPLDDAVDVVTTVYDALGDRASSAFRGILNTHAPELAELVTFHTFAGSPQLLR